MGMKFAGLLTAAMLAAGAAQAAPTKFVIFGDSFIDTGNIAIATGGAIPDASLGYWHGRFADGPNWADHLSLGVYGTLTEASLRGGTNFSFGGARAAQDDARMIPFRDEESSNER